MSSKVRQPPSGHGADPWWGDDEPLEAPFDAPAFDPRTLRAPRVAAVPARAARARSRRARQLVGLALAVLLLPVTVLRTMVSRSPRMRWLAIRLAVVLAIGIVLACSVGVILINNVVIGRSAELGELDDRRRELRRDNALLAAEAARLSSPDVVFRRATRELGMQRTQDVPGFMYLIPGSHALTPLQRIRVANRLARQRAAAAAPAPAPAPAPAGSQAPTGAAAPTDAGATP